MIDWFKSMFATKDDETDDAGRTDNPKVAAAALLVETALTDGIYADIESERILDVLMQTFDLDREAASEILTEAEDLAEEATGAHQFTKMVKTLPDDQRISFIQGLYFVTLADGEKCPFEDAFVRHVASLLHVEDRDRAEARKRAEQQSLA
ncbi:MAG: hypothetical protein CMK09_12375 [Ponticaulis sp.]|nr:hypothetical protein [Ponticaulis sp.]|tara:strand:- start:10345 stop:10797 length:453 start_codon:yes stop_codon:yes gene_type:complete